MSDYWEDRALQLEVLTQKKTDETVKAVNEQFSKSISYINRQAKSIFDRYTKNSGLTETQALELLNTKQTKEAREKLLQRLSETTDKEARKAIISVLDAPAYAHRISMLEALANEIYIEAVCIGAFQNNALTQRLVDIYEQSYYRRTFDIQQFTGEYYDFSRLSSRRVRTATSEPWNGKNYSKRVWDNTFDTAEKLRDVVVTGIMSGQNYKTMESSFLAVMGEDSDSGARFKASRLIRTEVNYISGKATGKAYEEAGIEEYTYIATLDIHTCKGCGNEERKSCAELDGEHFKVSEAKVGVNKHPMHPFCRCTDCPYIPGRKTVRAARDENGKSIQVPGDMTYDEWYEKYVDNPEESSIINKYKSNGIGIVSDKNISEKVLSKIKKCTELICEDFKNLSAYSESIEFKDVSDGLAENFYNPRTGLDNIYLDRNWFSDPEKLIKHLADDYRQGLSYNTKHIESLVAHEIGHNIHIALALKRSGVKYGKVLNPLEIVVFENEYNKILKEIYLVCFSNESFEDIQIKCVEQLGSMAYVNPTELIAQSFGNYYYGENKSAIAKSIVKYFMKGLR